IIGENELWEQDKDIRVIKKLGFAGCRLSLAIPKEKGYSGVSYFENKRIATSYPNILLNYFNEKNIPITVEELTGSVEIATGIGLADGILDVVSTGSTLQMNGLKEVEVVAKSEAVLIATKKLDKPIEALLEKLIFRINAVIQGIDNRYLLLNAPEESVDAICELLSGMKAPTILSLNKEGWFSLHSVIQEAQFW